MKAIVVTDEAAGTAGMTLAERPDPVPAINDVVVEVHASGFVPTELTWPSTWTDRLDRDRTPSIPGHELAGVVTALGYGTTGLSVGQRVFGLTDWTRDGTLAEYVAVEARNLAPLPGDVDFTVAASLPISGLTAWQGLFEHGRLRVGQSVLAHGAAGAVGSMVTQLAREFGAYVIGTGRAADRQAVLDFGAQEFVDLGTDTLEDVGGVDVVFDVIGGDIGKRSAGLVRAGGTLVSIVGPAEARPVDGLAIDFVVESDRGQLGEIVQRVRDGRLRTNIGTVATLDAAVAAFNPGRACQGQDGHPRPPMTARESAARLTARGEKTRARIVATAADLMRVRGVGGTTLDDVVVASNVSKSQLYRHFDDKQALVRAVIELVGDRTVALERERLSKVTTFAGLRRWRDALVENNALQDGRYGCPLGSLANEVADQDSIARRKLSDLFAAWHELFEDLLRRLQRAGLISHEADVPQLATGLLAAVQGGYLLAQTSRDVTPMASAIDMAMAYLHSVGETGHRRS